MDKSEDFCLVHLSAGSRSANLHRKTEERVYGVTPGKDGCHTCWSKSDELLPDQLLNVVEKGCLTATSTSRKEETGICVGNKFIRKLLFVIQWVYLGILHVLFLFKLWKDLFEACVEVAIEKTLVAPLDDAFGLCFELFLWHS